MSGFIRQTAASANNSVQSEQSCLRKMASGYWSYQEM